MEEPTNVIELHYWFDDDSHTMDAYIQNKCEFEFLGIIKEVSATFNIDITIETEPFSEGGLLRTFKIVSKEERKKAIITTTVIASIVGAILVTPITSAISKTTEIIIEKLFEDKEDKALDRKKKELEIENLKIDLELKKQQLNKNHVITKRRSNFYETLEKYPKVKNISLIIDSDSKTTSKEYFVKRENFKEYILVSDKLEPITIENAVIEIISPVLKKGKYKWRGIYDGKSVSFNMKSNEFKTLVQTGKIEFKNGSSIRCLLEIEKQINGEGIEQITDYSIIRVDEYFDNGVPIQTPEGKSYKRRKEANEQQMNLFDYLNDIEGP